MCQAFTFPRRHHLLAILFLSVLARPVAFVVDAHQVITLFPDLTLAVEEGEPDLAHDFFSTVKVTNYFIVVWSGLVSPCLVLSSLV